MSPANDNARTPRLPELAAADLSRIPAARVVVGPGLVLLQGDALAILPVLMDLGLVASDVFTDPPYSSGGQFRGDRMVGANAKYLDRASAKRYPEFSGDNRDQLSFGYWSTLWLAACREATVPGGLIAAFTDWRQLPTTTNALQAGGWTWRGLAVWDKTEGSRPTLGRYRNQAEFIAWGTNGARPQQGKVAPGVFRRAVDRNKAHATAKPAEVMADLLAIAGPVILDPFAGSGSTGVACVQTGRAFVGIEQHPEIFETAVQRIRAAQDAKAQGAAA